MLSGEIYGLNIPILSVLQLRKMCRKISNRKVKWSGNKGLLAASFID
jgi:hypothetical protein